MKKQKFFLTIKCFYVQNIQMLLSHCMGWVRKVMWLKPVDADNNYKYKSM